MTPLLAEYFEIVRELFHVRAARELTEDEEADYSMKLYDCRRSMTEDEERKISTFLRLAQQRWSESEPVHDKPGA